MKIINELGLIALVGVVVLGATNGPPTPPEMGLETPAYPEGAIVGTNDVGEIWLDFPAKAWDISFVFYHDTGFTNGVPYPISVQVPFEYNQGFIRVVAKQVEMD